MAPANAPEKIQYPEGLDATLALMRKKLHGVMPDFEIELKAEYAWKVNRLKRERNAVILGHNYMEPALYHSVPDYVGDSLQLSAISAERVLVQLGGAKIAFPRGWPTFRTSMSKAETHRMSPGTYPPRS